MKPSPTLEPCIVCGAPSTCRVGMRWACDQCAGPLRQAALAKRDALLVALRQMASERMNEENAA